MEEVASLDQNKKAKSIIKRGALFLCISGALAPFFMLAWLFNVAALCIFFSLTYIVVGILKYKAVSESGAVFKWMPIFLYIAIISYSIWGSSSNSSSNEGFAFFISSFTFAMIGLVIAFFVAGIVVSARNKIRKI